MTFTWQYNQDWYTLSINEKPILGKLEIGSIFYMKTEKLQFELEIELIENEIYHCRVIDVLEV